MIIRQLENNWGLDNDEKIELEKYVAIALQKTQENISEYSYVFGMSPHLVIKPLSSERYSNLSNFKVK